MTSLQNSWQKFGMNLLIRKAGPERLEIRSDLPGYDEDTQLCCVGPDDVPELVDLLTKWHLKKRAKLDA